jgi:hypothetical protein
VIRRKPPKSNKDKALGALMGLVGGKKTASGGSKGAKAGAGVAMLTAAAGLAFKNRDKLTSVLKRNGGGPETDASRPPAGTTGAQVHPVTTANATTSAVTDRTGTGAASDHTDTSSSLGGGTGTSSSLGGTDTSSSLGGGTGTSSSLGGTDTSSSLGGTGKSSSLGGGTGTSSSLGGTDTTSSIDPADASTPRGAADAPSSLDAPSTELGGDAGSGAGDRLAESDATDVPLVSPREPGTDEPPARG